jgi:PAS domain S-box-containing protein
MSEPDLYERIVRRSPDPIAAKDLEGRYRAANDRFVALLGVREGDVLGATAGELFGADDAAAVRARDRAVAESEARETSEERVSIDGREFVFETTRFPYYEDGAVAGVVTVRHDVTDRVRQAEELRERNERLDAFASVVSHDLRNPLDIAEGYVGKARETGVGADADADLEEAATAIDRAKSLVDDLLTLARADRRLDGLEPVEVSAVAADAWERVDTGGATIETDGDRSIEADGAQLRRLFENLFRNSVEHAGPGATVRVRATDDGFVVADDGPGIPAAERDRAFEPGYTTDDDGTGLGLAIVGRIAEAHGWEASLDEADGGGLAVRFEVAGG